MGFKEGPLPEVFLSIATSFFADSIRNDALTKYGTNKFDADPLKEMRYR